MWSLQPVFGHDTRQSCFPRRCVLFTLGLDPLLTRLRLLKQHNQHCELFIISFGLFCKISLPTYVSISASFLLPMITHEESQHRCLYTRGPTKIYMQGYVTYAINMFMIFCFWRVVQPGKPCHYCSLFGQLISTWKFRWIFKVCTWVAWVFNPCPRRSVVRITIPWSHS